MKALVTGGNGLIGAHLVRALLNDGYAVRALLRTTSNSDSLTGLPFESHPGDVLDAGVVREAAVGCDLLFHAAVPFAYPGQVDEDVDRVAAVGTANVLHAAKAAGIARVVVTSSSVVFGFRNSPEVIDEAAGLTAAAGRNGYAAAKLAQDKAALELGSDLGIEVVLVCPTMSVGPFGARLGPSNAIVVQYLADPFRMTYPGGINVAAAESVASGHLLAADFGRPFEHYLLGGENLPWVRLHEMIAELTGVTSPQMTINHTTAYLAATAEESLARWQRRPPLTTREQASMVGRYYWYSHAKAADLGYAPVPARQALAGAVAWLAASPHVTREMRAAMHLHEDVYAARRKTAEREHALREPVA